MTKARIREFWQCDADIIGVKSMLADVEIIQLAIDGVKELGLKCKIKVNNRKLLNEIITYSGTNKDPDSVIIIIDKLYKIGIEGVRKELKEINLSEEEIKKIVSVISVSGTNKEKIEKISKKINKQGINEIKEVFKYFGKEVEFDPTLARGLSYYTGTVFEIVLQDKTLGCSLGGGGRYDNMIGSFAGREEIPAVGISFGLEPMNAVMETKEKQKKTLTQVYVIPIKTTEKSIKIAKKLRDEGIKTDIDIMGRNISKNLNYANKMEIPYVIFIGEEELKQNKLKLRDMKTGKEKLLKIDEISKLIKNNYH